MEMHFINGWTIVGGRGLWEVAGQDRAFRRLSEARRWCNNNTPKQPVSGVDVLKALAGGGEAAPPPVHAGEDAPVATIRLAFEEARNAGDILGIFKPYIGHQTSCGRHVGAGCSCGLADTLEATRGALVVTPSASAPVEVTDEVIADLRTITQITPDFDGEDEDGERHELHQCLETAKRIARRALTAALKGKES